MVGQSSHEGHAPDDGEASWARDGGGGERGIAAAPWVAAPSRAARMGPMENANKKPSKE